MPLIRLQTSAALDDGQTAELMRDLSAAVAGALGKPESYMMVVVDGGASMLFAAADAPAAFADVRSVGGISPDQARAISARVSEILSQKAGVSADRTYLNFTGVPGAMWGFGTRTFG